MTRERRKDYKVPKKKVTKVKTRLWTESVRKNPGDHCLCEPKGSRLLQNCGESKDLPEE